VLIHARLRSSPMRRDRRTLSALPKNISESVEKSGGQKWVAGRQEFSSSASGASSKP
jgi:hypothetical protein